MNKITILILLVMLSLVGCTTHEVIYQNQTTETVIEKQCADIVPCPDLNCGDAPDCICDMSQYRNMTNIAETCEQRLNMCHIRLDFLNTEFTHCMVMNNSAFSDNITRALAKCEYHLNVTNVTLNEIKEKFE